MTSNPSELLDRINYIPTDSFPKGAIQEVIARKEEMIPLLLGVLESALADPKGFSVGPKLMHCTYAAFLLAQFRETRAYRPLIALLNLQENIPSDLFGDSIVEEMSNIIASVYDGDDQPLRKLIENTSANEFSRASAALKAYPALVHHGMLPRESVEDYFRELFEGKLERNFDHVWNNLCSLCGDLGFASLLPHVRKAFKEGLCDMFFDNLAHIERRAKAGGNGDGPKDWPLVDDAVSIMERWVCFDQKPAHQPTNHTQDALSNLLETREFSARPSVPPPAKYPGVKRNEPCPCASGRKFKKCCGG